MRNGITGASWKCQHLYLDGNDESGVNGGEEVTPGEKSIRVKSQRGLGNACNSEAVNRQAHQEISGGQNPLTHQRCHPMSA